MPFALAKSTRLEALLSLALFASSWSCIAPSQPRPANAADRFLLVQWQAHPKLPATSH